MDAFMSENKLKTEEPSTTLYYKNIMSTANKEDEKAIKKIISNNVTPTSADTRHNLVIYYKSRKTANLVMKNSCLPTVSPLQKVNVVYQHKCILGDCSHLNSRYIAFTTTTLFVVQWNHACFGVRGVSKRAGSNLVHGPSVGWASSLGLSSKMAQYAATTSARQHMEEKNDILEKVNDIKRFKMTEATLIYLKKPAINIQQQPQIFLPLKLPLPGRSQAVS
ncbi:hypothetical protein E2C01_089894 [Portunus trituberculatus]|uniref:Uncharacterized protein n=1 Tax=Portunus trituberculatus TaxID=210409 RepID=A0A5B7JQU7_PORTR|nr:hypothetical protein [Portunus trituberculatus]